MTNVTSEIIVRIDKPSNRGELKEEKEKYSQGKPDRERGEGMKLIRDALGWKGLCFFDVPLGKGENVLLPTRKDSRHRSNYLAERESKKIGTFDRLALMTELMTFKKSNDDRSSFRRTQVSVCIYTYTCVYIYIYALVHACMRANAHTCISM